MAIRMDGIGATLRRAAFRRQAPPGAGASPQALEASLARISAEVTAEAIERAAQLGDAGTK